MCPPAAQAAVGEDNKTKCLQIWGEWKDREFIAPIRKFGDELDAVVLKERAFNSDHRETYKGVDEQKVAVPVRVRIQRIITRLEEVSSSLEAQAVYLANFRSIDADIMGEVNKKISDVPSRISCRDGLREVYQDIGPAFSKDADELQARLRVHIESWKKAKERAFNQEVGPVDLPNLDYEGKNIQYQEPR